MRAVAIGILVGIVGAGCKNNSSAPGDAAADMAAGADLPPTPDSAEDGRPAERTPSEAGTPDLAAAADTGADGTAVDVAKDGALGERGGGDRQAGDGSGDEGVCTGWTTLVHLSPADAKALIETSDPIVINVHVPYEGDIPGTDVDIPYTDIDALDAYLKHDLCADVLLVCKGGSMSQSAGSQLIARGYRRIRDLDGGMMAWEQAGYPLLKDGGI